MNKYNEPEDLVPPDFVSSDMKDIQKEEKVFGFRFPFKRLVILVILSAAFIGITGTGISIYSKSNKIQDFLPYIFMSLLVFLPTAFAYYYFFKLFNKRLYPYEFSNDLPN